MPSYVATQADGAFQDALCDDSDDFTLALLMQSVSDAHLAVLAHDHTDPKSAAFKAMIDAEIARRGTNEARRANKMAKLSLVIALVALIVAIGDLAFGWTLK